MYSVRLPCGFIMKEQGKILATLEKIRITKRSKIGQKTNRRISKIIVYTLLIIGSIAMLLPIFWMVRTSFMTLKQIFMFPIEWIPNPFAWKNYPDAFTIVPMGKNFLNTLTLVIPALVGDVTTSALSAYGFSRLRWKGREVVFGILLTALMIPQAITLIPRFLIWSNLKLLNTYWPMIIPTFFGGSVFYVFLLRQFYQTIPIDLDEAAYMDGANPLQVFWYVILPLSRPALITCGVFSVMYWWNDFLGPLIYLTNPAKYTLALGLLSFTGYYTTEWHMLMAGATVTVIPIIILFFVAQRYFIEGITMTGMKV